MNVPLGPPDYGPGTTRRRSKKRLIVCCDGTWMNSDYGFTRKGPFSKKGTLQVPSNVTRISRCFKRHCSDGTLQIISYESGVGSGNNAIDSITGGAFGAGLAERVRAAYAYLCANYTDGDEIILVGFSRGAFTARSVAGIIGNIGLLTREGVEDFYPIFKDMQNWMKSDYDDPFPTVPFRDKPKGPYAADEYRARLEKMGHTRVWQQSGGGLIKVKAVCVWDTVGSLGIPQIPWLEKFGIRPSNDEYKWLDTSLSDRIEHAFQALALDETRAPFSPAVWERPRRDKLRTDLRQVWFPGNHGNCGGGWNDQGVADCTLAWMMDQMASVGVEFDSPSLRRVFENTVDFYMSPEGEDLAMSRKVRQWAVDPIYDSNKPIRPWALGAIQKVSSLLYSLSGDSIRTPGMYKQVDPKTSLCREKFLQDTNEKVHSSVRVRLACEGLGLNDASVWSCEALSNWRLKRAIFEYDGRDSYEGHDPRYANSGQKPRTREGWIWKYVGDEGCAPKRRVMEEEPLGPYERYLLDLSGGTPNVYDYAERRANRGKRRSRSRRTKK